MSKKDIIYIDSEDDITGIIEKVTSSNARIVALVPPRRNTVLKSTVNMKLLKKSSEEAKKRVVLITTEDILLPLAGAAGLYVAESLQSRPQIPETHTAEEDTSVIEDDFVQSLDDDSDGTLDGEEPEKSAEMKNDEKPKDESNEDVDGSDSESENVSSIDLSDLNESDKSDASDTPDDKDATKKESPKVEEVDSAKQEREKKLAKARSIAGKSKISIPSFSKFRVRMVLGGVLLVGLVVGWYVAFNVLPSAKIAISAQTTNIAVSLERWVDSSIAANETDDELGEILAAQKEELKKTVSVDITPTGEKDNGQKASGVATLTNCENSSGITVPSGTILTDNSGNQLVTTSAVSVPGSDFSGGGTICDENGTANVDVEAVQAGDSQNLSPRGYTVAGVGNILAFGGQLSGGVSDIVKVVSEEDVALARRQIEGEINRDDALIEIKRDLGDSRFLIEDTIFASLAEPTASPAVDEEVTGEAKLSGEVTYTVLSLANDQLTSLLDEAVSAKITDGQQSLLNNGLDTATVTVGTQEGDNRYRITIDATGLAGPEFDVAALAQEISGKKFSEIVSTIEARPGVNSVDVNLAPFWVVSAPNPDKIEINVEVTETNSQ